FPSLSLLLLGQRTARVGGGGRGRRPPNGPCRRPPRCVRAFGDLLGNGIFNFDGETWVAQHKTTAGRAPPILSHRPPRAAPYHRSPRAAAPLPPSRRSPTLTHRRSSPSFLPAGARRRSSPVGRSDELTSFLAELPSAAVSAGATLASVALSAGTSKRRKGMQKKTKG
ncbi:Os06g0146700, partial [Oryza sativa Japonica Group]